TLFFRLERNAHQRPPPSKRTLNRVHLVWERDISHRRGTMHPSQRGWGEAMLGPPVYGHGHVPGMPPVYTMAAMQPGAPHPQHHVAAAAAAAAAVAPLQQQLLAQQAEEMRKSAKRAANRRSANTCRLRKKFFVENMADANERMRKRARVLSLLPDMILAMRRDGVITYASENCRQFLQFTRQ
ncbi:unnamed protein product, partial [Ectocarpus sp. 8 AP-2014]